MDQDRETAKACRFFFLNIFLLPSSENPLSMSSLNCVSTLILTLLVKKNKQKHLSGSCGMSCFSAQRCGFCTQCPLSDGSPSWKDNQNAALLTATEPGLRFQNKAQALSPERLPREDPGFAEAGGVVAAIATDFC